MYIHAYTLICKCLYVYVRQLSILCILKKNNKKKINNNNYIQPVIKTIDFFIVSYINIRFKC